KATVATASTNEQTLAQAGPGTTPRQAPAPGAPPAPGPVPPFRDFVAAGFQANPNALNVAKFAAGHVYGQFRLVQETAFSYALQRQQLNQQYPTAIAEKRFQDAMAAQEKRFLSGMGPFS